MTTLAVERAFLACAALKSTLERKKEARKLCALTLAVDTFVSFMRGKNAHRGEALNYARKRVLINHTRNRHMYLSKDGQCIYLFFVFNLCYHP